MARQAPDARGAGRNGLCKAALPGNIDPILQRAGALTGQGVPNAANFRARSRLLSQMLIAAVQHGPDNCHWFSVFRRPVGEWG